METLGKASFTWPSSEASMGEASPKPQYFKDNMTLKRIYGPETILGL